MTSERPTSEDVAERLAASLLAGAVPASRGGPRATPSRAAALVLSLFIAYHAIAVCLYTLPNVKLARALYTALDPLLRLGAYMAVTGSPRGWGLFTPDANQANYFTRVLIEDGTGRRHDLQVDIYGRRTYPYLIYDRLGNLNGRVAQGAPSLRPYYAAWFCREWERSHRGQPAREVVLIRVWTRIPTPEASRASGGYHPMSLFPNEDQETHFDCASTPGGRLPNDLRRRYGLAPRADSEAPAGSAPSRAVPDPTDDATRDSH
jgi:hypothetical protein